MANPCWRRCSPSPTTPCLILLTELPSGRYAFHDLIRKHSWEREGDEGREAERACLQLVQRAAADRGWDTWVWQIAEASHGFYLNRRYLADWISTSTLGIAAAHDVPAAEAMLRTVLSRAFTDLGDLARASEELAKALPLAEASGDLAIQASVWEFRGRVLDLTDHDQAVEAYHRSQELSESAGSVRGYGLATYFLGCSLSTAGRHDEAVATLSRALDLLLSVGDHRMAARARASVGVAYAHIGRPDDAVATLTEAAEELAERGLVHHEAHAREHLAEILDDPEAARHQWRAAHAIYVKYGSPRAEELVAEGRLDL